MGILPPRNGLSLCSGGGGLDMGLQLAEPEFHTRCYVEWESYPQRCIIAAQRAGYFAPAPIWDDVTTFDGRPWRGYIDTILAGYPCQPFSTAGQRKGADDERHLWPDIARIIAEVEPRWVFLENVAGHVPLGADTVLRELRGMGFTPAAGLFTAAEVGATHERKRWFCVSYRHTDGYAGRLDSGGVGQKSCEGESQGGQRERIWAEPERCGVELADTDDGYSRPERQQRGGELGFQPESGGNRDGHVENARRAERRARSAEGDIGNRQATGRIESAGGAGQSGEVVENALSTGVGGGTSSVGERDPRPVDDDAGPRRDNARQRPDADTSSPRATTGCPEPPRGQQGVATVALDYCRSVSPPGPADRAAWAAVLAADPTCAPALARRDVKAAATRFAALCTPDEADAILCRTDSVEAADIMGAVGEEAKRMVDAAEAFTRFRGLADGMAERPRALRLLGNGVHPLAAGYAWRALSLAHGLWPVDLEGAKTAAEADESFLNNENQEQADDHLPTLRQSRP